MEIINKMKLSKLNKNTKALMLVHWGGYPLDLHRLKEIQDNFYKKHGFKFVIIAFLICFIIGFSLFLTVITSPSRTLIFLLVSPYSIRLKK